MALSRRKANPSQTWAERATLAASIGIVAALVAGIVWIDTSRGDTRPQIEVSPRFSSAYEHVGTWYLPVTITNVGDRAVDSLRVDIVRDPGDGSEPEISDLEFAFVAAGEQVKATVAFDEEPLASEVRVDIVSVTDP